jgi:hypothetical protein
LAQPPYVPPIEARGDEIRAQECIMKRLFFAAAMLVLLGSTEVRPPAGSPAGTYALMKTDQANRAAWPGAAGLAQEAGFLANGVVSSDALPEVRPKPKIPFAPGSNS